MSSGHKPLTPAMPAAAEPPLAVGGHRHEPWVASERPEEFDVDPGRHLGNFPQRGDRLPREPHNRSAAEVFVDGRYISADTFARMGASPQEAQDASAYA